MMIEIKININLNEVMSLLNFLSKVVSFIFLLMKMF